MSNTLLVIGAAGMLGSEVVLQLQARQVDVCAADILVTSSEHLQIDITDPDSIEQVFNQIHPTAVINCAAYTDVDGAEAHEDMATRINADAVATIAKICKKYSSYLLHVSTDYVFDGQANEPYQPDDPTAPQSAYGRSKWQGENMLQAETNHWAIVRTAWLFGPRGKNFIDAILHLARQGKLSKVVNDQIGCPTYTCDLAHCLIDFACNKLQGIYHFCNGPVCSWFDFAAEAIKLAGIDCTIKPCTSAEFPRPAPRPAYSVLDTTRTLALLDWQPPTWPEALQYYLSTLSYECKK